MEDKFMSSRVLLTFGGQKKKKEFPEDIMILLKMRKLEITLRLHHVTGRRLCPLLGNELPA